MSKSDAFETDFLEFVFQDAPLLAGVTQLWLSLHSASPGEAGDQSTNEVDYVPYGRISVARTAGGWTVVGNEASPVASVTFPQVTSGNGLATHFGIGTAQTGPGYLLYYGTVTPNIGFVVGENPVLTTDTTVEER